jgi:glycosyltransferase involved in cell wall biosynthesis
VSYQPGSGYGDAALGYIGALESQGVPVTWTPLEWPSGDPTCRPVRGYQGPLGHLVGRPIDYDTLVVHLPPGDHRRWLAQAGGRRTVLVTTWETDRVPDGWAAACDEFDAVIVPARFHQAALRDARCRAEVHVVAHCARPIAAVPPARFDRIGDRFTYYTIGTWSTRKAMPDTITAFLDAFDRDDDVALVVKTDRVDQQAVAQARRGLVDASRPGWQLSSLRAFAALVAGRSNLPEIYLIRGDVPAAEIDMLHARGDCFFSLARSEGWGLCIADALVFGNPVVVTGWGGQLDYLGSDYPLLVDFDLTATSADAPDDWFAPAPDHRWARARHEHAVELLRWVASHREEAADIGRRVGSRVSAQFGPDEVGRQLLAVLAPA